MRPSIVLIILLIATFFAAIYLNFFHNPSVAEQDQTRFISLSHLPHMGVEDAHMGIPDVDSVAFSGIAPERIQSQAIDMDLPVQDSTTQDIDALEKMLTDGPVRYVTSAKLGEEGNIVIFGHSSLLPIVGNKMYKAFNRISELKNGDIIILKSDGEEYRYSVTNVTSVDMDAGKVDISKKGYRLTLITCDIRSGKDARFVVEAELV